MNFSSSILYVGSTPLPKVDFEFDQFNSTENILPLPSNQFSLLIIEVPRESKKKDNILTFAKEALSSVPDLQSIFLSSDLSIEEIRSLKNQLRANRIFIKPDRDELQTGIIECIENFHLLQQNRDLLQLYKEQNDKLLFVNTELESRVEKRQSFLNETKQKSLDISARLKTIIDTAVAAQEAKTISEIETQVKEALQNSIQIEDLKVTYENIQSKNKPKNLKKNEYSVTFHMKSGEEGEILFAAKEKHKLTTPDKKLLRQVTETVGMTVERLIRLKQTRQLTELWESTFNSILDAIVIVDESYNIIQNNKATLTRSNSKTAAKCYERMYGRSSPCKGCRIGSAFRIHEKTRNIEVMSQRFSDKPLTYVNIYKDITEDIKLQKMVLEKAKVAELGTIGGSIAHELNNPLAGMITLIQLVKNDLEEDDPRLEDILEIEVAAQNCKEIIQNLLNFTRVPSAEEFQDLDLREIVNEVLSIIEIKSRARGINFSFNVPDANCPIYLHKDYLNQSLLILLNTIVDAQIKDLETSPVLSSELLIDLVKKENEYVLEFNQFVSDSPLDLNNLAAFYGLIEVKKAVSLVSILGGEIENKVLTEKINGKTKVKWARISFPLGNN